MTRVDALPRFSIVIAAHDAADTIADAVDSNLTQDYDGWFEVIVVDDGSTDGTIASLTDIDDARLRTIRLDENVGRSAARNAAVHAADGDYIVICDADDLSLPGRLRAHAEAITATPDADVWFGRYLARDPQGRTREWPRTPDTPEAVDDAFQKGKMAVAHGGSAFRRRWFFDLRRYDGTVGIAEDYDLFARGWRPGCRYVPHDDVVLEYRTRGAFPTWQYWWDNERYRRAITRRVVEHGKAGIDVPLSKYLKHTSSRRRRLVEYARYRVHRFVEPVRSR